jgi:hypothetical protein
VGGLSPTAREAGLVGRGKWAGQVGGASGLDKWAGRGRGPGVGTEGRTIDGATQRQETIATQKKKCRKVSSRVPDQ